MVYVCTYVYTYICIYVCPTSPNDTYKSGIAKRHCKPAFIKQVLPKLLNPQTPGFAYEDCNVLNRRKTIIVRAKGRLTGLHKYWSRSSYYICICVYHAHIIYLSPSKWWNKTILAVQLRGTKWWYITFPICSMQIFSSEVRSGRSPMRACPKSWPFISQKVNEKLKMPCSLRAHICKQALLLFPDCTLTNTWC